MFMSDKKEIQDIDMNIDSAILTDNYCLFMCSTYLSFQVSLDLKLLNKIMTIKTIL